MCVQIGAEIRAARHAGGLSLRTAAGAVGLSYSVLGRIERGLHQNVTVRDLCLACAAVGLEFGGRAYPDGDAVRDVGHERLLARLRERLPSETAWRTEVPLPIPGDRRAIDAVARLGPTVVGFEAETRLTDIQALSRRLSQKQRDAKLPILILVAADTRHNRAVVATHGATLRSTFELGTRAVLQALTRGEAPSANGFVLL